MEPSRTRLREPVIILVLIILSAWWLLNTLNTGNALWFLPIQPTYEPSRIVVRNYGTAVTLQPGMDGFLELNQALSQIFSAFKNNALIPLGLSDETLRRYHEEELVIEVYYPEFVTFNTPVRMSRINQLLVPIDATHGDQGYVFLGSNGRWLAGAMVVEDATPLMEAMRQLGYLQK